MKEWQQPVVVFVALIALVLAIGFTMDGHQKEDQSVAEMVPELQLSQIEKAEYQKALQDEVKSGISRSFVMERWVRKIAKNHPEGGRLPVIGNNEYPKRVVTIVGRRAWILLPAK